ncbi:glycosyltransferase family 2 protein [Selenomonas sp. AB3002]|uniref:glycosyltransferase family 2 protein n=1 Tax=Selenomonas sp. AB3002 TaxID=1392502 RepID=UPI000495321C
MDIITVIIPVYNMSKYLDKCLESLMNQTYKDYKIIMIDDGSTDNSMEKCMKWKRRDERITVVSQKNMGQGAARNLGVRMAASEYITFLDADDWWHPKYIELMLKGTEYGKHDIILCDMVFAYADNSMISQKISRIRLPAGIVDIANERNVLGRIRTFMCGKVYRRSLLTSYGVEQPDYPYEDLATIPYVVSKAKSIYYVPQGLYYYLRNRTDSTINNFKALSFFPDALMALYKRFELDRTLDKNYNHLRHLFWGQLAFIFHKIDGSFSFENEGKAIKNRTVEVVCGCFPELKKIMNAKFIVPSHNHYLLGALKKLALADEAIIADETINSADYIIRFRGEDSSNSKYEGREVCIDSPTDFADDEEKIMWDLADDIFYNVALMEFLP